MRRSHLTWLLPGLIGLLVLSGCQQQDVPITSAPPSHRTSITALIWVPDWPEQMPQIAAEFSKLNPDVQVDVQFMIGNSVEENIKPHVAAGTMPDLLSISPNAYLAELAEQRIPANVNQTSAWTNMLGPLKRDWTSRRGTGFGISGDVTTTMIYYNREMFEKADVDKLPANFDESLRACVQFKRAGFTPMMLNGAFPNMLGNGPFVSGFANNVIAYEPNWKSRMAEGTLDLDTPEVVDISAKMALLPERGYVQASFMATGYDDGICFFKESKVAMVFQGSWVAGQSLHGNRLAVGALIPPWNKRGEQVVPVLGSETGFAVYETPNKAATKRFLEFVAGKGLPILQRKRHNISPFQQDVETAATDPEIVDHTNTTSRYLTTASPYYSTLPLNTLESLHGLMQDVLLKKMSPRQVVKRLDEPVKNEAKTHYK